MPGLTLREGAHEGQQLPPVKPRASSAPGIDGPMRSLYKLCKLVDGRPSIATPEDTERLARMLTAETVLELSCPALSLSDQREPDSPETSVTTAHRPAPQSAYQKSGGVCDHCGVTGAPARRAQPRTAAA